MNRNQLKKQLSADRVFDYCIIGGGASGLGVALQATQAGYSVCLIDRSDFGKCTSSRSTKLIHGGVRYLAQGRVGLVLEALKERGYFFKHANNIKKQSFILPVFSWFDTIKYFVGLTLYDLLSGKWSLGRAKFLNKAESLEALPHLNAKKLKGAIRYFDGQFDDTRLLIDIVKTIIDKGNVALNYFNFTDFINQDGKLTGVHVEDKLSGEKYTIRAKQIVNATGVFTDEILDKDNGANNDRVIASRGTHIVVDSSFLDSDEALMIPKTSDGRVLFAIPWQGKVIIGTTDVPTEDHDTDPVPFPEEIDFIVNNFNAYSVKQITDQDILTQYAGLRPLVQPENSAKTKDISRSHKIIQSKTGLTTIVGGKWTTFRKMGEDVVKHCAKKNKDLKTISDNESLIDILESRKIEATASTDKIHPDINVTYGELDFAIDFELTETLDDLLARRTRALLQNAQATVTIIPAMAEYMRARLNLSQDWKQNEIEIFEKIAKKYLITR